MFKRMTEDERDEAVGSKVRAWRDDMAKVQETWDKLEFDGLGLSGADVSIALHGSASDFTDRAVRLLALIEAAVDAVENDEEARYLDYQDRGTEGF
jgi:hypothetical protein